jgi:hypothetical protein
VIINLSSPEEDGAEKHPVTRFLCFSNLIAAAFAHAERQAQSFDLQYDCRAKFSTFRYG